MSSQEQLQAALRAFTKGKSDPKPPSVNGIAKRFGVSETSLRRAIKKGETLCPPGRRTILTEHEETQLSGYCINMQKLGFGLTKSGVNHCVMEILHMNKRSHPFGENGPGRDWWSRFMRDHADLSFRVPQELSEARAQRANATIVANHFDKLRKVIEENSLTPERIWNMDETGFVVIPKLEKVVARKGARQVHKVAHGNSHDHISVAPTISAAGSYIPPLFIYKGSRAIPGLLEGAPAGTAMGFTDTGYMRESLFQMYIEHFVNSIPPTPPVLLILDGHKSHVNYTSVDFCRENDILLYALPPHTTHVLQPSEIPFAKLKKEYSAGCEKFRLSNDGELVTKHSFAKILGPAYIATYTPAAITNAFRGTGIWPLNPDAISPERLEPSLATERLNAPILSAALECRTPRTQSKTPIRTPASCKPSTRSSTALLKEENKSLKNEINSLKKEILSLKRSLEITQEELETYKNPGTCSLRMVLKYPFSRNLASIDEEQAASGEQTAAQVPQKKKKKDYPICSVTH